MAITKGAIMRIYQGAVCADFHPVLEVRDIKRLSADGSRWAVSVADGETAVKTLAFKGSDLAEKVERNLIGLHSLLQITEYQFADTPSMSYIAISKADVVGFVPPEQRVPNSSLSALKNHRTGARAETGLTQADPVFAPPTVGAAYTTPERPPAPRFVDQTPPPQPHPPAAGRPEVAGPAPWANCAEAVSEAPTQNYEDSPPVAGVELSASVEVVPQQEPSAALFGSSSAWEERGGSAASNPYSTAPAAGTVPGQAPGQFSAATPFRWTPDAANPYGGTGGSGGAFAQAASFGDSVPALVPPGGTDSAPTAKRGRGILGMLNRGGGGTGAVTPTGSAGSVSRSSQGGGFLPISEISPYTNGKWRIKARVTLKSDIRRFTNTRGEGQLFKVDLSDKSGAISATFFGKAVDAFYGLLQPGQVYIFSKAHVKAGNPRFDRSEHVLTFEESSTIEAVDDDEEIPGVRYEFKDLCNLESMSPNTLVDVKAVIYAVQEAFTFTARTSQKEMTKRELGLWDPSGGDGGTLVDLVLWGERALSNFEVGSVIFLKDARVGEWQSTKNLSSPTQFELNVVNDKSIELKRRFTEYVEKRGSIPSFSMNKAVQGPPGGRKTLQACREEDINLGPPPMATQVPLDPNGPRSVHRHVSVVTVANIPTDRMPCYPSCPEPVDGLRATQAPAGEKQRTCSKKVTEESGTWRCAVGHTCHQPVYKYLCRMQVMDHTECLEVNMYDAVARHLFGCEAQEYARTWDDQQAEVMNQRLLWRRLVLKFRAQKETWQDSERVRYSVDEAAAVPLVKEARQMLAEVLASVGTP